MPENDPRGQQERSRLMERLFRREGETLVDNHPEIPCGPDACFLLENDPPEQHGKPIVCTQCWNALCEQRDKSISAFKKMAVLHGKSRENANILLIAIGKIAGMDINAPGIKAIEVALKALVEFGETEGGESLKAEADWQRLVAAEKAAFPDNPPRD